MCSRLFLFIIKQKNIQQKTVRLLKQNEICKELGKICGDLFIVMRNILLFRSFFVPPFCSLMCTKESNGKNKEEKWANVDTIHLMYRVSLFLSDCFMCTTFIPFSSENVRTEWIIQQHLQKFNIKKCREMKWSKCKYFVTGYLCAFFLLPKTLLV